MNQKIAQICLAIIAAPVLLLAACNNGGGIDTSSPGQGEEERPTSSFGTDTQSRERQAAAERIAQRNRIAQNTEIAWEDFEDIMLSLSQQNEPSDSQEMSQIFKSTASELGTIITTDVDPEVQKIVSDSQALFIRAHRMIDNYVAQDDAIDTQVGSDAVRGCIGAWANGQAENIWEFAGECFGGGIRGGVQSGFDNIGNRTQLETSTQQEAETITNEFESLRARASNVAERLNREYKIQSRLY